MANKEHKIICVQKDSIAEELGIQPGDALRTINGRPVEDILDYHFLIQEEYVEILIAKANGEEWLLEVEKDYEEELGLSFENGMMDDYRSCSNKCIFCFIDQMPPDMRDTLYFKDDDARLSFLQGNYVTLTNMSDKDIARIIQYRLSPINISFQTTNPQLRCEMLRNRFAGEALKKADALWQAGIQMNGQIVLCKGINDKAELERSICDLLRYLPHLKSVSVVPVGLTKYRKGLYPLTPFSKEEAKEVLSCIHRWQDEIYKKHGLHFIHASDEWYLLAQEPFPAPQTYDGYPQLENGVGMLPLWMQEVAAALCEPLPIQHVQRRISAATGILAAPAVSECLMKIQEHCPLLQTEIFPIRNDFFGEQITVSGLITGQDLAAQLSGKNLGEELLLPCHMLRMGENVFLDDMTVEELEEKLQIPIRIVDERGLDFVQAALGIDDGNKHKRRQIYEQTNCSNRGTA